ncbi:15258_t:CDS:10 [Entrophospora sp. SA101]|nr:15258_t:CDS:10 [Entrophospora sp. SA101]
MMNLILRKYVLDEHHDGYPDENDSDIEQEPQSSIAPHLLLPNIIKYSTLSINIYSNNHQQQNYRKAISTRVRQFVTSIVDDSSSSLETDAEEKYQELKRKISELDQTKINYLAANEECDKLKNSEDWSRLVVEFVDENKITIALKLFDKMKSLSLFPNQEAFTAMLRGLSEENVSANPVRHLRKIIDLMNAKSKTNPEYRLETEHLNYLLKTCQNFGNLSAAYSSYEKYVKNGIVKPDKSTYLCLLATSIKPASSDPRLAQKIANDIWDSLDKSMDVQNNDNNSVPIDDELVCNILATYKSNHHLKDAFSIIDYTYGIGKYQSSSSALNLPITQDSLNTIINMCIEGRRYILGLKYYNQIIEKYPNIEPDISAYNGLMSLYNSTYQYNKILELFNDKIKDTEIKPNRETFKAVLMACHNLHSLDGVKYFIENYSEIGIDFKEIDIIELMKSSIKRARINGNPDDIIWLLNKLDEADPVNVQNKQLPQLKNMNKPLYLTIINLAYDIVLKAENLSEDKKIQWQKDKRFFEEKYAEVSDKLEKILQDQMINNIKTPTKSLLDNKLKQMPDHANYMSFLENQLSKVSNSSENYYNYLPVVQSSGYGSTGYPPATPKSDVMLKEKLKKQQMKLEVFKIIDKCSIHRALYFFSKYAYGILTDTNSSVANLAPSKDKDSSARKYDCNIHKPFIYIVTQDCLSGIDQIPHDEDISAHDIIQFGRPLWASNWVASKHSNNQFKFRDVINLAKAKLLGSTSSWDRESSIAPELFREHMATLIAIDKDYKNYIITYPSEPILSEASLELISEGNIWKEVLQELDFTFRSGGILDAGSQGELAVRLLLLNAWHHLVLSKKSINSKVAFSSRFPVIDFLQELFGGAFPKEKFSHFNDFLLEFTHLIPVTYVPVKEDLIPIYK